MHDPRLWLVADGVSQYLEAHRAMAPYRDDVAQRRVHNNRRIMPVGLSAAVIDFA